MIFRTILTVVVLALLVGCKKKDEQMPVISNLSYSFLNNDSLFAGGTLFIDVSLEDNLSLGGVSVSLKEQRAIFGYKAYSYQSTKSVLSIANKTFGGQFVFPIGDSTLAAPYQILVEAFDKEGNQADPVTADVYIYTVEMPKIHVDSISLAVQDTNRFVPQGNVSAFFGLKKITAEIKKDGTSIYTKSWDYTASKFYWSLDSIGEVMLEPNFADANLLLKVTDKIGNNSYKRVSIRP
jgi:hypothetical protein